MLLLSTLTRRIRSVRTQEIFTYADSPGPFTISEVFGFGKPAAQDGYPTVYAAGVVQGETGIYRSTDEGATWDKIGGWPLGIFDWIDAMDGDTDAFGKVYLGFTSSGFACGEETN